MATVANTDCIFFRDLHLPQEQEHITEWVMQRPQEPSGHTATVVQGLIYLWSRKAAQKQ